MSASIFSGPLQEFYQERLAAGIKPDMAQLTLARKIAAIALTIWKRGESFDPEKLKAQALERPTSAAIAGLHACSRPAGETLGFEGEYPRAG